MKKKQVKCYTYIRVSTLTQADNFSLDAQREKLHKYAEYQDMVIAGEYADEGFSGKNIQGRLGFKQMLDDIQSGKDDVEYVLVFKLSRFGRNAADVLYSLQLMQDFGVNQEKDSKQPREVWKKTGHPDRTQRSWQKETYAYRNSYIAKNCFTGSWHLRSCI